MKGRLYFRWAGLAAVLALLLVSGLSLFIGARSISLHDVITALSGAPCTTPECLIVQSSRWPRTLTGLWVGMALGVSGMLMQQLTRNPLADPGILGINAGASAALVLALTLFGITRFEMLLIWACVGALLAALFVSLLGIARGRHVDPVRMTLAGVALWAVLEGVSSGIALLVPDTFDYMRFWHAGSLDVRHLDITLIAAIPAMAGVVLTFTLTPALRALALGDEVTLALGAHARRTRLLGILAITLMCGSATACAGPIAFIGLMMPPIARRLVGHDPAAQCGALVLLTPTVLLSADIVGRVIVPGDELRVSVMTALLGAPMLIYIVRHLRTEGEG